MTTTSSKSRITDQDGALLLIALAVLGVIALAAIYLSLILLNEIKSARFTDNGVVSHYVAESGIEQALWKLKLAKQAEVPGLFTSLNALTDQCAAEDDGVGSCTDPTDDPERTYEYNSVLISAPDFTTYDVPQNSIITADIYDPTKEGQGGQSTGISGVDIDWFVEDCSGSARLETTYTTVDIQNVTIGVPITRINVCGCGDQTPYGYTCTPEASISGLDPAKFYRFTFRSLDTSVKKFTMTASTPSTNIPSQVEIQATGTYRESQSKITARTLWKDTLSGLFGFVVFSEESLIKDAKSETGQVYTSLCGFCSDSPSLPASPFRCSSDADCTSPATCTLANTSSDTIDAAETKAFCSEAVPLAVPPEVYTNTTQITQTDANSCNSQCNGYTFCGDGTIQTPNGFGDGVNNGNEECDGGAANSDTVPLSCRTGCEVPYCGDGVIDFGDFNNNGSLSSRQETCDDGDRTSHSGNDVNNDECTTGCILTVCGDNIVNNNPSNSLGVVELCDGSANGTCPLGCTASCTCQSI
ncbi:MAG: hypothetical protein HY422_02960 [Candidatus Komeilibacteria bacterium]|nr:hypothetical protein [Candidatus Komeilibacteria bacterium]